MAIAYYTGAGPVVWNDTVGWPSTQTITESHLPDGIEEGDRIIMVITYRTTLLSSTSVGPSINFNPLDGTESGWDFVESGEANTLTTSGTRVYTAIYSPELFPRTITVWDTYHNDAYSGAGLGVDFDLDPDKRIWTVQMFSFSPPLTHVPDTVGLPYTQDLDNDYLSGTYNHESPGVFPDGSPYNLTTPWFDLNRRNSVGDGNVRTSIQDNIPIYTGPNTLLGTPGSDPQRWKVNLNTGTLVAVGMIDFGEIGTGNFSSGYDEFSQSNGFVTVYVRSPLTDSFDRDCGLMMRLSVKYVTGYGGGQSSPTLYRGPYWSTPDDESGNQGSCVLLALDAGRPASGTGWRVGQIHSPPA